MSTVNRTSGLQGTSAARPNAADDLRSKKSDSKDASKQGGIVEARVAGYDVNLSPNARQLADDMEKARQIALATPDVREDRIAKLKAQIASGEYKVDAEAVANGIIRESVLDHLATTQE